jgi:hypothetical protein
MKLEGEAQKVEREMREEGKVQDVSLKGTYNLDHQFAMGLKLIKEYFYQKEIASRKYVHELELKYIER